MGDDLTSRFGDGTRRAGAPVILAGRYRVVREIGRGAMGTVYLAEDLTLDHVEVAIKVLPPVLVRDPVALKGLKREALLARKLSHPNIVPLRTFEQSAEGAFLVTDCVDGQTLMHQGTGPRE